MCGGTRDNIVKQLSSNLKKFKKEQYIKKKTKKLGSGVCRVISVYVSSASCLGA